MMTVQVGRGGLVRRDWGRQAAALAGAMVAAAGLAAAAPASAGAAASGARGFGVIATIPVASPAGAPAVDPLTGRVYIPGGDALTVVDAATNTVTGTIALGAGNGGSVAVDPGTGLAFVAGAQAVSVVSLAAGTVIKVIRPGGELGGDIAVDPLTHMAFTTDYAEEGPGVATVLEISEATDSVTATAPLEVADGFLSGLASDPVTGTVYVTGCDNIFCDSGTLFGISEVTRRVIAAIPAGSYPQGVAVDPGLRDVYVAAPYGLVLVVDEATSAITAEIGVGNNDDDVAADPAARIVYASNLDDNTVSVIDEAADDVIATVPVGAQPAWMAVDPASHDVYVVNSSGGSVSVIGGARPPAGCGASPGACGYPDAQTAGVPPASTLAVVPGQVSSGPGWHFDPRGFVQVTGAGADLSGLLIPYNVNITAPGVTLTGDLITHGVIPGPHGGTVAVPPPGGPSASAAVTLRHAAGVTIEDTTIDGSEPDGTAALAAGIRDVYGDSAGLQVRHDKITGTRVAVQASAGLIDSTYISSAAVGITSTDDAGPLIIEHNTILAAGRGYAIGLFPGATPQDSRLIDGNLLAGGNYVLYGGQAGTRTRTGTGITVTGNRFSRRYYPAGGRYGPVAHYDPAGPDNAWYGNFWDDATRTPVPA